MFYEVIFFLVVTQKRHRIQFFHKIKGQRTLILSYIEKMPVTSINTQIIFSRATVCPSCIRTLSCILTRAHVCIYIYIYGVNYYPCVPACMCAYACVHACINYYPCVWIIINVCVHVRIARVCIRVNYYPWVYVHAYVNYYPCVCACIYELLSMHMCELLSVCACVWFIICVCMHV